MGTDGQSHRRTLLADEDADFAQPERARRSSTRVREPVPTSEPPRAPSSSRPTAAEHARAVEAIDTLHELRLLRGKATAVEPNVIALALAWRSGDRALDGLTQSERNVLFGVQPPTAKTQRDWVVDAASRRLDRLAAYERHRSQPFSGGAYCAWCEQAPPAVGPLSEDQSDGAWYCQNCWDAWNRERGAI